jgi:thioredoxin-related protein
MNFKQGVKMYKVILGIIFGCVSLCSAEVLTEGVQAGQWTMDYSAAKKYAKDNKKVLFINFTGSDWCGWCKLMDKAVFSDPSWSEFAKKELSLAYIDFPKNKSLVPAQYVGQNEELKKSFQIKGYPTYLMLAPDGQTLLGRLGAERNITPQAFIDKVSALLSIAGGEVLEIAVVSRQDEVISDMNQKLRDFVKGDGFTKKIVYEDSFNKLIALLEKDPVLFSVLDVEGFVEIMVYGDAGQMNKLINLVKKSVNAGTPEDSLYRQIDEKVKAKDSDLSKIFLYMSFYSSFGQREKAMELMPDMEELKKLTSLTKAQPWLALLKSINSKSYLELCFALQEKDFPIDDKVVLVKNIADFCSSADDDFMDKWFKSVFDNEDLLEALKKHFDGKIIAIQKSKNYTQRGIDLASNMRVLNHFSSSNVDPGLSRSALRYWQLEYAHSLLERNKESRTPVNTRSNAKRVPKYIAFPILVKNVPSAKTLSALSQAEQELFSFQEAVAQLKQGVYSESAFDRLLSFKDNYPKTIGRLCNEVFKNWARTVNPNRNNMARTMQVRGQMFRTEPKGIPLTRLRQMKNLKDCQAMFSKVYAAGIKVDPAAQVAAFVACFSQAEVISEDDVRLVFSDLDQLDDKTLLVLCRHLLALVQRDWVDDKNRRKIQLQYQTNRSEAEAQKEAINAYQAVINLLNDRLKVSKDDIQLTVSLASALYDFAEYKNNNKLCTAEEYSDLRNNAFQRFRDCARLYESLLESRESEYTINPYSQWFSIILGASNLQGLEMSASVSDVQLDELRKQLFSMDEQWRERHINMFGEWLSKTWPQLQAHVKLPFMSAATFIMGEHPSLNKITSQLQFYEDLLTEVNLNIKLDGSSTVGHVNEFGVFLSLHHSKELSRESGGFDKYAMGAVNINGRGVINYRKKLTDQINKALKSKFDLGSITWIVDRPKPTGLARKHWQETPLAYLTLRSKDPAVDKIPEIIIEMDFNDGQGQVVLPVRSNIIRLSSQSSDYQLRPYENTKLEMVLDSRGAHEGKLSLEIQMTGEGLLPDIKEIIEIPESYKLKLSPEKIEPLVSRYEQKDGRTIVTSELSLDIPIEWQGEITKFIFPGIKVDDIQLEYKKYKDADIVTADKEEYLKAKSGRSPVFYVVTTILCLLILGLVFKISKGLNRKQEVEQIIEFERPQNISAVSVIAFLNQIKNSKHQLSKDPELEANIKLIEESYFAESSTHLEPQLDELVEKWCNRL